jgi:2-polyprenyl-6-methoxyphenol hydroxylase-like FAD-dependent oxidoreductase
MKTKATPSIVIIGGGIASSTLAIHLARAGWAPCVVDEPPVVEPLVGESLLPAVIPILNDLGIEEEMREFSMYKPGSAFILRNGRVLYLPFEKLRGVTSPYAYNVPRPRFDEALRSRAGQEGARLVRRRVRVESEGDLIVLDEGTLAACGLTRQPDLVVDCSGRRNLFRKTLGLGGTPGKRRDVCVFAHFRNVDLGVETPGVVVITVLQEGWSWRIPLADRTSVGVVLESSRWRAEGASPEARLEAVLRADPVMAAATRHAVRISPVGVYTNYQWLGERFVGKNWVAVGDSAGFVDPALSSGVLLALEGATSLARALVRGGGVPAALRGWEAEYRARIDAWQQLVDSFYDGRLFASILQGEQFEQKRWLGPLNRHIARQFTGVVMGATTLSPYSRRLVRFLLDHPAPAFRPAEWAVA